jgi:hypothetical protein
MGHPGRGDLRFAGQREDRPAGLLGQIGQQPRIAARQPCAIGEETTLPSPIGRTRPNGRGAGGGLTKRANY